MHQPLRATPPCPEGQTTRKPTSRLVADVRGFDVGRQHEFFHASRSCCKRACDFLVDENQISQARSCSSTKKGGWADLLDINRRFQQRNVHFKSPPRALVAWSLGHPRGLSEVLPREDGLVAELLLDTQKLWYGEKRKNPGTREGVGRGAKETAGKGQPNQTIEVDSSR